MNPSPFLVVDKKGIIGEAISQKLVLKALTVCVSQKKPESDNIVFVPYVNQWPVIPDYTYSHIFVVDSGGISTDHLSEFLEKAKIDNAMLIFITSLADISSFYEKIKGSFSRAKIIILGDVIGKNTYPKLINNAIKFGKIKLANDGLFKTYPVFLDDVVSGIIEVAYGGDNPSSIFYLFPKDPPTELSISRMIQKTNPMVKIDFDKETRKEQEHNIPPNGKYLLSDNYPLKKKIRELNIESLTDGHFEKKSFNANINNKKKKLFSGSKFLLALFLLLISPFVLTLTLSFFGFVMLGLAKTELEKGSIANTQKSANAARILFSSAQKSSVLLLAQGKIIGQGNNLDALTKKISLGSDLSQITIYITDGSKVLSEVFSGKSKNPQNDFAKGTKDLKNAITIFRQIEAAGDVPLDIRVKIKSVDNLIKMAENTIDDIQNIFGLNGKKVYLVLFQNNMELRPGGGFIGSYGLLTFDSGKMVDFSINDVYDADGQLKGHVEPPYPIRRHLKIPHLYLRDSNFDVDFAKGASSSAILLNAELGVMVDGVIGIDVSFVKSILSAMGPLYVADYKETVTSSNLYELTQSHAEKNFFPGSRQKKDFLRSLFTAMKLEISSGKNISYLDLAKSIESSILEKHLLFAFSDKNLQNLFTINKWSSALWEVPVGTSSNSINDFLGINEANIGVNKANYFVERNINHNVSIDENGKTEGEIKISYKNVSGTWPGGDYVNYLRIILPLNTAISSISFDGVSQDIVSAITDPLIYEAKNFVKPFGLELEKYDQSGKTIYGFLVDVKAGKSKEIKIEYELSQNISLESETFFYKLHIFKQPGIDSYPYSFSITFPEDFEIISGSSSDSLDILKDKELKINFVRKN